MAVVILGGGGHGSDMLSIVETVLGEQRVAILDEGEIQPNRFIDRDAIPCTTPAEVERALGTTTIDFIAGVGYPGPRRRFVTRALEWGWTPLPAIVHHSSQVMARSSFGEGTVIMGLTWVSPCVTLGRYVYVGYGVKIGHDVSVGDFTSVFPGVFLAGEVIVGTACMIGANATIMPGVRIGDGARVGAGAVVVGDVDADVVVAGVPARPQ